MGEFGKVVSFNKIRSFPLFHRILLTLFLNRKSMRRTIGLRLTEVEETEAALKAIARLPHGARLDGLYLAGGYWRATWRENYGQAWGMLIVTESWEQYRDAVSAAIRASNRLRRRPVAAELVPAKLRTSATA